MSSNEPLTEKYRPTTLDDVLGQEQATRRMKEYVSNYHDGDLQMPHLLLTGPPGVGKSSAAFALAHELYGDGWEESVLDLNASDDRGIDLIRGRVKEFARSAPVGEEFDVIVLDEADHLCLPSGSPVVTGMRSGRTVKPIEEVSPEGEVIPSLDTETKQLKKDTGRLVDSGTAEFYEVNFKDGRSVTASPEHPFFVLTDEGEIVEKELRELGPGDEIVDLQDSVGLKKCGICSDWTRNSRFCSKDCKNEGHSREVSGEDNPRYGEDGWNKGLTKDDDPRVAAQTNHGPDNGNWNGDFHGKSWHEFDNEELKEEVRRKLSKSRSGKSYEEIYGSEESARKERRKRAPGEGETGNLGSRYHLKDKDEAVCEVCESMFPASGIDGIYVHHIDGDQSNNEPSNLMNVCPDCHNNVCHNIAERTSNHWEKMSEDEKRMRVEKMSEGVSKKWDEWKEELPVCGADCKTGGTCSNPVKDDDEQCYIHKGDS